MLANSYCEKHIHDKILLPLLRLFAYILELDDEELLANIHRYDAPGLEYLRYMQYYPRSEEEDARLGNLWAKAHSDYNSFTFLFYQPVAGLQVLVDEGGGNVWKYVKSENPGDIIVNIADALEFLSGGFLKSTVHRVVRPPADQASKPRLGLIYFARPEAGVSMVPVKSKLLDRLGLSTPEKERKALQNVTAEGMHCTYILISFEYMYIFADAVY